MSGVDVVTVASAFDRAATLVNDARAFLEVVAELKRKAHESDNSTAILAALNRAEVATCDFIVAIGHALAALPPDARPVVTIGHVPQAVEARKPKTATGQRATKGGR